MLIVGAGGHAKEILDILIEQENKDLICFYDNTSEAVDKVLKTFNVIHNDIGVMEFFKKDNSFSLGIGVPKTRQKLAEKIVRLGGELNLIRANSAIVSKYARI